MIISTHFKRQDMPYVSSKLPLEATKENVKFPVRKKMGA